MKPARSRRRFVVWLAVCTLLVPMVYVFAVRWPSGGLRAGFGFFSGSWTPVEAKGMTEAARQSETAARAERIRLAVLVYSAESGRLPGTLAELTPRFLPSVPPPLTSTKPFVLRPTKEGFTIKWEAWPNALYECYWIDQAGEMFCDM